MTDFAQGKPIADDRQHAHVHHHTRKSHRKDEAKIVREKNRRSKEIRKAFSRILFLAMTAIAIIIIAVVAYLYVIVWYISSLFYPTTSSYHNFRIVKNSLFFNN